MMARNMTKSFACSWLMMSVVVGFVCLLLEPAWEVGAEEPPEDQGEFSTRLFIAQGDGSKLTRAVDLPEYQKQGSPCWSQDGKLIAFDAWQPQKGETHQNCRVIVVNADGTNPRVFEDASMPSFSPGGQRLVVSRPKSGGVWAVDVDGTTEEDFVPVDKHGWGADWSPDGKIVYAVRTKGGHNLRVVDLVEGRVNYVFAEDHTPYTQIFWNMAWSPDGKRIVYKASNRAGKLEVGIVDARGEKFGLVTRDEGELLASFAWSPDASQILFVKKCPERQRFQIYAAAPDTKDVPKLLAGLDPLRDYSDIAYSPDGKQLLITCHKRTPAK